MADGILVGGVRFAVTSYGEAQPIPVLTWEDHGKQFKPGDGHNTRRREHIDLCVWHWTGGERPPLGVFDTLRQRRLGVEFAIGNDGTIYQFADPLLVNTAHAGRFNRRSVGVEITNFGFRRARHFWRRFNRAAYTATIHGRARRLARFHPAQIRAAVGLADTLSAALHIPPRVPLDDRGRLHTGLLPEPDTYRGHCGHYHLSASKLDPGADLLTAISSRFVVPAAPLATS